MIAGILILHAYAVIGHLCKTINVPKLNLRDRVLSTTIERSSTWDTMRFYVDWSQLDSYDKEEYEKYIDAAFVYFSNALEVHQITSSSSWDEFYDYDNSYCQAFFDRFTGKVIQDTDMLVIITSEYNSGENYAGYSTTCGKDPVTNQPIGTLININTAYIDTSDNSVDEFIMLMTHELCHSLGFSYDSMTDFIKSDGSLYSEDELFTYKDIRGLTDQKFLSTPKVKELARAAFGCSSLPGVQLENQGGDGSIYQHWDKRMVGTEFMNPQLLNSDAVYSDLTLAVFEDSGWYKPDYSYGTQINFGYEKGCDFIDLRCIIDEEPLSDEFCVDDSKTLCDFSHLSYGSCGLYEYDYISEEFQYFSDETLGGDYFLDYCPVNKRNYDCRSDNYADSDLGEKYCLDCRCVEGTFSLTEAYSHASCHEITCYDSNFDVTIGDITVTCNTDGEELEIDGFYGTMICPSFDKVCADVPCRNNCFGGKCVNGRCKNGGDEDGFSGEEYPDYGGTTPESSESSNSESSESSNSESFESSSSSDYGDLDYYIVSGQASFMKLYLVYLVLEN